MPHAQDKWIRWAHHRGVEMETVPYTGMFRSVHIMFNVTIPECGCHGASVDLATACERMAGLHTARGCKTRVESTMGWWIG